MFCSSGEIVRSISCWPKKSVEALVRVKDMYHIPIGDEKPHWNSKGQFAD